MLDEERIVKAIKKARTGISQYIEIMDLFPTVNVAENREFQRKFNAFYRVRQKPRDWYEKYFSYMQRCKGATVAFDDVLDELYSLTGRCEPSFSSKFVATLDPERPVWDKWVLQNTNTRVPSYASKTKMAEAKVAYSAIQEWYRRSLNSTDGKLVVHVFNGMIAAHDKITDLKKLDFVLWQTRTTTKAMLTKAGSERIDCESD
jgi:hypothetical protein